MIHRRQWHLSALSVVAGAALLVACGGSEDELKIGKIVSFGDSLSDLGTYSPATSLAGTGQPPFFGGRFTTNTHTGYTAASNTNNANLWVEWVAAKVGVPITQAVVGFATTVIPCPAAATPALAGSCTGYGQGGSRVTDPNGINKDRGALTFPVVDQVARHLASFTSFSGDDIVFVWAGANDGIAQFSAVGAGLPPATAVANMQTAATELAALVKDQILANGAKRVVVMNVPDLAVTPGFSAFAPEQKALLSQLTGAFNTTLEASLDGANVRFIDTRAFLSDAVANPAQYGFTNTTTPTCDPAKIQVITGGRIADGSSLACNAVAGQPFNGMRTGASASTWLFADAVHPTTGAHKVLGDIVIGKIKEFGWIPPNL